MRLLRYEAEQSYVTEPDPTTDQLREVIEALNNSNRTALNLHLDIGTLTIVGGNKGRVVVGFQGTGKYDQAQYGRLIDPSVVDQNADIEISAEGNYSYEPLGTTVTKDIAIEVATYFLEHEALPEGLRWKGRMDI
jgi:hypothetical protein